VRTAPVGHKRNTPCRKRIGYMEQFKKRSIEFRLNEPNTFERNLRGATIGSCEEQYLFLICAYDFVKNPASLDLKLAGMRTLFFTEPNNPVVNFDAPETPWYLNISQAKMGQIRTLLGPQHQQVMVSYEGTNHDPDAPHFAAPLKKAGGVMAGGAANYNLFTKAIEIACSGFIEQDMTTSLAQMIRQYRDTALSALQKNRLVDRYNTLRAYYDDQTLTKFGLTQR
jgi:hypothetical protein